jgi:DNA polymerase-3 subunit beta
MEFSVKKFDLLQELSLTQGVIERKTTIPILGNILCEASENQVTLTATDLDLTIRTACPAKVKKEGAGTIPAKKLLDLVKLLPEGEIRFKLLENHWVEIAADRKKYKMVGMAKDNFLPIPPFPTPLAIIPAQILSSLIAKTAFAISSEESRFTLNGALLLLKPETITMVATDGHRLAIAETNHKFEGLTREVRPLVPRKALLEVQRLANEAGETGQIEFALDESHLFFRAGERLLISRMLSGQFPNYEAVLPRENSKHIVMDRNELNDAVRRVSQLADQRSHAVKISITGDAIEFSASSPEYGEAKETIEKEYKGEPLAIGFNAQYMLDFLSAAVEGPISLELKDEQSAAQMRPLAEEAYRYRYVIAPVRI